MDKKIRILGIIAAIAASIIIINLPSNPIVIPEPTTNATKTKFVEVVQKNLKKLWPLDFPKTKIFFTEKVIRITESENKLVDALVILDKIPGAEFDNGGVIKFGPDNKLYVGTGDATDQHSAQDLQSLSGKILRLNDDGTIPSDNPFQDLPVFLYGYRNPQGMAWDKSGNLYVTEHGPTKNDEINFVKAGQNFGWPNQECSGGENFVDSLVCYNPSLEPAGIVFYSSDKLIRIVK